MTTYESFEELAKPVNQTKKRMEEAKKKIERQQQKEALKIYKIFRKKIKKEADKGCDHFSRYYPENDIVSEYVAIMLRKDGFKVAFELKNYASYINVRWV